ncbi:MAG: amidohydrolase family protein [Oscillospiraceae bacterium]|nr:amidohydrolase family protein [Oscillospiraceae bacterium]
MFDTLIRGGTIVDGSGAAPYCADVALKDGKIAAIGHNLGEAAEIIDADGFCVTPGFIDIHRHGDAEVFRPNFGRAELRQGLTTILNGACGVSLVPFGDRHREELLHYLEPITGKLDPHIPTESLGAYLAALRKVKLPLNVGMMLGAGTVRADLFGYSEAEPADLTPLHRQLERGIADGAYGISLGLGYAPECFYSTDGLIRALQPLSGGDVPITVHMRQEGDGVCDSVAEMIAVAKALRCPMHISHLKAMGKRNWHVKIPRALELMERARGEGVDVSCDVYLYDAGSTQLLHLLPPDFLKGGVDAICARLRDKTERDRLREAIAHRRDFDNIAQMVGWDNIMLSALNLPQYQPLIGKTVAQAAELLKLEPVDCLCQLLADERCAVTMIDRMACEDDVCTILRDAYSSVISDSTYPTSGMPHPRVYGSYVRIFERFCLEKKVLDLPTAVRKITALPAEAMRIRSKGLLHVGMDADINIFKPELLHERATYLDPRQESEGLDTVLVGGKPAILHGAWTDIGAGTVI